jgi:hypothetical protein
MPKSLAVLCGILILSSAARGADIQGDYLEARTADIYTGPCFSNAEIFITGNHAVMAWKVTSGSFEGVDLKGLSVAAAVRGSTTFSEDRPEQATSILIVDERADSRQREALLALAKSLAGDRLKRVVDVKVSRISLKIEAHDVNKNTMPAATHGMPHAPRASFWASGLAQIVTRPLDERDHACGNEIVAYPPLSKGVEALPAYTLGHKFQGAGLGTNWDDPNCRSSFVGHFSR